jgi:hypothetical protein
VCREIEKGFMGHYLPKITPPQSTKPDGPNATSDDEKADILKHHFQAVFGRRDVTKRVEIHTRYYTRGEMRDITSCNISKFR